MSPGQLFDLSWQHTTVPQEQLRCPLVATLWLRFLLQELSVLQEVSSQSLLLILSVDSNVWLLRFYLLIRSEIKLLPFLWLTQHWPVDVVAAESIGGLLLSQSFAHPCLNPPVLHLISFPQLWTSVISLSSVKYFELSPCHRAQCSFVLIVWNLKNNSAFTIFLWTCWCPSPAYSSSSWSLGPFGLLGPTIPGGIQGTWKCGTDGHG